MITKEETNAYIMHAGVLGMKWGVRKKDENFDNDPQIKALTKKAEARGAELETKAGFTESQKKAIKIGVGVGIIAAGILALKYPDIVTRNAKAGNAISASNFMKRYLKRTVEFTKPLTKKTFDAMDDVDVVVPKNTVFKRITGFADESLDNRLYTTFKDTDNDKYAGIYANILRGRLTQNARATNLTNVIMGDATRVPTKFSIYSSEMTQKVDIKSPSQKKRVQMFIDILDDKKSQSEDALGLTLRETIDNRNFRDSRDLTNEEFGLKYYGDFARQLLTDDDVSRAYFNKVRTYGYNALVDDNDFKQLSDIPMILLDAKKTTGSRTSTLLTNKSIRAARKRLVEISN